MRNSIIQKEKEEKKIKKEKNRLQFRALKKRKLDIEPLSISHPDVCPLDVWNSIIDLGFTVLPEKKVRELYGKKEEASSIVCEMTLFQPSPAFPSHHLLSLDYDLTSFGDYSDPENYQERFLDLAHHHRKSRRRNVNFLIDLFSHLNLWKFTDLVSLARTCKSALSKFLISPDSSASWYGSIYRGLERGIRDGIYNSDASNFFCKRAHVSSPLVPKRKWAESKISICKRCRCLVQHCLDFDNHVGTKVVAVLGNNVQRVLRGPYRGLIYQKSRREQNKEENLAKRMESETYRWPPQRKVCWKKDEIWPEYIQYNRHGDLIRLRILDRVTNAERKKEVEEKTNHPKTLKKDAKKEVQRSTENKKKESIAFNTTAHPDHLSGNADSRNDRINDNSDNSSSCSSDDFNCVILESL